MPIVAVAALPHTPQLLVRPETEDRDLVLRVHVAYGEIKRSLTAIRPDVICMIGGDHVEGFFLTSVPALAVYVGSTVSGKFDRYRYTFDVHEPLARALLRLGPGAPRRARREAGAGGPPRLGRPLTLPRQRSLRLARLRLGPPHARSSRGRARERD